MFGLVPGPCHVDVRVAFGRDAHATVYRDPRSLSHRRRRYLLLRHYARGGKFDTTTRHAFPGSGEGGGGSGGNGGAPRRPAGDGREGDDPERRPSLPSTGFRLRSFVLAYLGLLAAAGAVWDAVMDAALRTRKRRRPDMDTATVSVIIPALNEERVIADTVRHVLQGLDPKPCEVIVVDGGSTDGTVEAARAAGANVIRSRGRGRGLQMNQGTEVARGSVLLFLHADTQLPKDAVAEVRKALSCPRTVLVGFRPEIKALDGHTLWFSTLNNLTKTWYGPALVRPASYIRGLRCLFGDQALCCRAEDFRAAGGYRADIPFMEDTEMCIALHRAGPADTSFHKGRGRVRMLMRESAVTSGRRMAACGELGANLIFAYVAVLWLAGASPEQLHRTYKRWYHDVR